MNKRIPYTIIPYFFNNIYERANCKNKSDFLET